MFGRKCTLCGGKLDGRGICTECGLDNNKADKNYKINESSCDDMPLTHVHEEPKRQKAKPRQENIKQRAQGMQSQNTQSRNPRQDQGQHEAPYGLAASENGGDAAEEDQQPAGRRSQKTEQRQEDFHDPYDYSYGCGNLDWHSKRPKQRDIGAIGNGCGR